MLLLRQYPLLVRLSTQIWRRPYDDSLSFNSTLIVVQAASGRSPDAHLSVRESRLWLCGK